MSQNLVFLAQKNVRSMHHPNTNSTTDRIFIWGGHLFFWVLIMVCLVFYQERLLAFDTANYIFHVVTFDDYFIKHNRYISYLTQWVPLFGMHQGWAFASVLKAFSASFYIWFYLFYVLIVHGAKNVLGGVVLIFGLCLAMRYKFYAAISELFFGVAIAGFLIGWLTRKGAKYLPTWIDYSVVLLCLIALFGAHIILVYPILVFLVFQYLYENTWKNLRQWIMPTFIVGVFFLKFMLVQGDDYESDRMSALLEYSTLREMFTNQADYFIFSALQEYATQQYWLVLFLFTVVLAWLLFQKKWLAAIFIVCASVIWLLINILTYADLGGPLYIMLDGYLAVFGLIWATPFYFFLRDNYKPVFACVAIVLVGFSTWKMVDTRQFYRQRLTFIQETLDMYPEVDQKKLIVPRHLFDWENMWFPYEVAHESLMLTALESPEDMRTIYVDIDSPQGSGFLQSDGFIQFHGAHDISTINNSPFFNLPKAKYIVVDSVAWKE